MERAPSHSSVEVATHVQGPEAVARSNGREVPPWAAASTPSKGTVWLVWNRRARQARMRCEWRRFSPRSVLHAKAQLDSFGVNYFLPVGLIFGKNRCWCICISTGTGTLESSHAGARHMRRCVATATARRNRVRFKAGDLVSIIPDGRQPHSKNKNETC